MILKGKAICANVSRLGPTVGKVAGIYSHCFNILTADGELVTIFGDTDQYSTRAVLCEYNRPMQELPICNGMDVRLEAGKLQLSGAAIDWSEAKMIDLHREPLPFERAQWEAAAGDIGRNMERILELVRSSGKKSPLLEKDSPIGRRAAEGITRLKIDYRDGLEALVGLGIGLTPSCDDLLGGMAAWMYLTGQAPAFLAELRRFLKEKGEVRTTAVSRNLLADIAGGIVNDGIYELICRIVSDGSFSQHCGVVSDGNSGQHCGIAGAESSLERLTKRVMDYGSTSGMETCLGIVLGYHLGRNGE